jgi:large exoprotein involved in heme utilization and adhesion
MADSLFVTRSLIESSTVGNADAGQVSLAAHTMVVDEGGLVSANTGDPSGLFAPADATGRAGNILLTAGDLRLTNGATIDSSTFNAGAGGTVAVTATERVAIGGRDSTGFGSALSSVTAGKGNAGEIVVTAPTIEFAEGGDISTNTGAAGNAGAIRLTTGQLTMTGDTRITSSATETSTGASGNITIAADESARLSGGALITATSAGQGNAGSITIDGGKLIRAIDSTITGEAQQASGGNVTLIADDLIHLTRTNVTASVQGGPQSIGGNILFDPQIILLQNSKVVAQANQGAGGTITLVAGTVLADPSSLISASSQSGPQGTVTVQAPIQNLSGAMVPM